jgi:hypothetical protein
MKKRSAANEARIAVTAMRRCVAAGRPPAAAKNADRTPNGLTTTNSVTNSLRRSCHICAPGIGEWLR